MAVAGLGRAVASGRVVAFDDERGWGTVEGLDGREHWFHCTGIADGTRTIEVGTAVRFRVAPGHLGRWEATNLEPGQAPTP